MGNTKYRTKNLAIPLVSTHREAETSMAAKEEQFRSIRERLAALGLFGPDSLVMLDGEGGRSVVDGSGKAAAADIFDGISAKMAVLTAGPYASRYAAGGGAVRASTDDTAQMFGACVRFVDKPAEKGSAFLLRDRGFVVTGRFENELAAACILMEKMCMAELLAPALGGVKPLARPLCALERRIYLKKYSRPARLASQGGEGKAPPATAAHIPDLPLRQAVIEYGKRLVRERLIQATWGNVSLRIDQGRFLITPSGVDYDRIRPEEVVEVQVSDGSYPAGQHPSSERRLHQLIYRERRDVQAIIHTHSAACQVFAACRKGLVGQGVDYPCAGYAVSGSKRLAENAAAVMALHDGCIMANHGFAAVGDSLETALARAIGAEKTAAELLGICTSHGSALP